MEQLLKISNRLNGKTGVLVPHGDVGALSGAIGGLAGDRSRIEALGHEGVKFAAELTWEEAARKTRDHLEETIRKGGE